MIKQGKNLEYYVSLSYGQRGETRGQGREGEELNANILAKTERGCFAWETKAGALLFPFATLSGNCPAPTGGRNGTRACLKQRLGLHGLYIT